MNFIKSNLSNNEQIVYESKITIWIWAIKILIYTLYWLFVAIVHDSIHYDEIILIVIKDDLSILFFFIGFYYFVIETLLFYYFMTQVVITDKNIIGKIRRFMKIEFFCIFFK